MMGPWQEARGALFYQFSIEDHVPADHLLRSIDRFVDLSGIRRYFAPFYSSTGRPSIDPELMIRMLLVGYCLGIRSERRLCEEVHATSPKPPNMPSHASCAKRSKCSSPTSSAFSASVGSDYVDHEVLETNSTLPQPTEPQKTRKADPGPDNTSTGVIKVEALSH